MIDRSPLLEIQNEHEHFDSFKTSAVKRHVFQDDSAVNLFFPWKNLRHVSILLDILGNTSLDCNSCSGNTIRAREVSIIFLKPAYRLLGPAIISSGGLYLGYGWLNKGLVL